MSTTIPLPAPAALASSWRDLQEAEPRLRIRDAAERLGVSEANLLETRLGDGVVRLQGDLQEFFPRLEELGHCMALTRNQHAVHEVKGHYRKVSFSAHTGLVLDERIDLRLFHHSWQVAYAVSEEVRGETRHSIQLFDKNGIAAHKVYLQADADFAAYERLVADFTEDGADDLTVFAAVEPAEAEKPDAEVDVAGFQEAWLGMKDTHDFYMITRRFGLSRTQSLRLAPEGHAIQVDPSALRTAMDGARDAGFPVMFFVGSPGVIQIFTGEIHKLLEHGDWYNVMDPGFNLHVRETGIDAAWIVRKPTEDGIVTSLELYDEDGGNILMMFGARKPGKPELEAWRELADGIAGS